MQMGPTGRNAAGVLPEGDGALVPAPPRPFVADLGPVGPWAFGRTEWNPASGLTGEVQVTPYAVWH